jgi:hypothetical protein
MRRPSAANLRRLAAAEATRRDVDTSSPLVPLLVQSREELAELNAFFGYPPTYAGRFPDTDGPPLAEGEILTVPALLAFLKEKSCPA